MIACKPVTHKRMSCFKLWRYFNSCLRMDSDLHFRDAKIHSPMRVQIRLWDTDKRQIPLPASAPSPLLPFDKCTTTFPNYHCERSSECVWNPSQSRAQPFDGNGKSPSPDSSNLAKTANSDGYNSNVLSGDGLCIYIYWYNQLRSLRQLITPTVALFPNTVIRNLGDNKLVKKCEILRWYFQMEKK